jgi:magnesium-transporting ATPase (P-type)
MTEAISRFPNCLVVADGRHIRMRKPADIGSPLFNYRNFFSMVLTALVDTDYCSISTYVGAYGASNNSNTLKNSNFYKKNWKEIT